MKNRNLSFFNLLKILAALTIACLLHYHDHFIPSYGIDYPIHNNILLWWSLYGYVLVELFFMLSGVLFFYAYFERIRGGAYCFNEFFSKRLLRVWPLCATSTLVMYMLQFVYDRFLGGTWSICGTLDVWSLVRNFLFCGNSYGTALNGPLWYVNVLLICYVIAFILTRFYDKCGIYVYLLPIILGIGIKTMNLDIYLLNLSTARGYICFFVGVLLALFLQFSDRMTKCFRIIISCGCIVELLAAVRMLTSEYYYAKCITDLFLFMTFLVFPEVIYICYNFKWLNQMCDNRFVEYLGKISFDIYIWNFPLLIVLRLVDVVGQLNLNITSGWFLIILAIIHLLVGVLSHQVLEGYVIKKLQASMERN